MKKAMLLTCILLATVFVYAFAINEEQVLAQVVDLQIFVDGVEQSFSLPIVTVNNRTYIPLRETAESMGMNVEWDAVANRILITTNTQEDGEKQESGEDLFLFRQNEKYGYMDRAGNVIIDAQFDDACDFVEGTARVAYYVDEWPIVADLTYDLKWGFIDVNGELITPIMFADTEDFHEGLAYVREFDGSYVHNAGGAAYYIDKEGSKSSQTVIGRKYFTQGFMPKLIRGGGPSGPPIPDPEPQVWSYIDSSGNLATDKEFEDAGEFSDGFAVVKSNGKYGIIDMEFNTILKCKYDGLKKVGTELYAAKMGEKYGLIDIYGTTIADFEYFHIGRFSEGWAPVRKERKDGAYMDMDGNIFLDSRFSMVYEFIDGFACVEDKATGKAGVINRSGEYVIAPTYESLIPVKGGLIRAIDEDIDDSLDYYYIDLQGNKIEPIHK